MRGGTPAQLSPEQIEAFRARGFLALDAITTPEEVARLRTLFDRLFEGGVGRERGAQFDLAGSDEEGRPAGLPQILDPAQFAPELEKTLFRRNALAIARQLLGPEAHFWFEHAILKPALRGAATPWHQDEAHRTDTEWDYEQISIWMPLQPATRENGCMEYIPGSHLGPVLPHRSPDGDPRVMALECCGDFDASLAVPCPLPPGGAAIHHAKTLHRAGPNSSDIPRRAYILAFNTPRHPATEVRDHPWNREKQTAAQRRKAEWEATHPGLPKTGKGRIARLLGKLFGG